MQNSVVRDLPHTVTERFCQFNVLEPRKILKFVAPCAFIGISLRRDLPLGGIGFCAKFENYRASSREVLQVELFQLRLVG